MEDRHQRLLVAVLAHTLATIATTRHGTKPRTKEQNNDASLPFRHDTHENKT